MGHVAWQRQVVAHLGMAQDCFRPEAVVALTTFLSDERIHPLPPLVTGRYRHYQGGECEALGIVRHSETLEPKVLYRAPYRARGLWVRPHVMYFESIVTHFPASSQR